ncbi:Phosphatidylinositol glycan anchor biosynthesis class U protein like [Verticillium longisporum]|uniref:Phosphatidylinositol glycan anchor biosynthesis class U protein like n=1 Tax=Verticillium longisporum TaxID=100787 RepID=A0A8I3AV69_VERLO|nr:Phosphatidylinositol glycan anchor biosynthesis class U protein like [Verticillium longisporum]
MQQITMTKGGKAGLFLAAAALRLVLFVGFPRLPDLLTGRVEISTPVTSFKRLQEGLFLYNHNVSPYDGGVYHQAPLLLPLFSLLPDLKAWPIFASLLYIVVDLLSADALAKIADSGDAGASKHFTSPRRATRWNGVAVAAAFLFNPFTIATCLGRSTGVFSTCAILHAIAKAIGGAPVSAVVALTFAGYLSLSPLLLLPPLLLLAYDRQAPARRIASPVQFAATHAAVAGATLLALLGLSALLTGGSWAFLGSTYGVQLTLSDLTPNVGLWWYFFVEMFDSFRAFFLAVFWLHLASYVGGLAVRLRAQPLAALTLLLGVLAIFKPYPSLADASLFAAAVPLYRHVFPLMRYPFVTASAILYASFLGPAFYHLWIYAGSGNANFFYAITLVWSLAQSLLVSDLTFAILRDEWEVDRPAMVGKEVRQI